VRILELGSCRDFGETVLIFTWVSSSSATPAVAIQVGLVVTRVVARVDELSSPMAQPTSLPFCEQLSAIAVPSSDVNGVATPVSSSAAEPTSRGAMTIPNRLPAAVHAFKIHT